MSNQNQQRNLRSLIMAIIALVISAGALSVSIRSRMRAREAPIFRIDSVDIELKFVISVVESGKLKFDLKVLGYDDNIESATERIHSITVNMKSLTGTEPPRTLGPLGSLAKDQ